MKSGMTLGKFMVFMTAFLMWVGGAYCSTYDAVPMAWVCFLGGLFLGVWVLSDASWDRHNDEIQYRTYLVSERTKFALSLNGLDAKALDFLSVEWPELGVEFGNEPQVFILHHGNNTGVNLTFFQKFLADSNAHEFADLRKYNSDKYLQETFGVAREMVRKQWRLSVDYLLRIEYLMHGSMAGSHTYLWKSKGHYRKIARKYMITPIVPNVGEEEGGSVASLKPEQKAESGE